MKKKTKKSVESVYSATVKVLGKTYKASGKTISDAIAGLTPENCKGYAILTVVNGDIMKDKILQPTQAFRLFNTLGLSRDIALKNVASLFSGL